MDGFHSAKPREIFGWQDPKERSLKRRGSEGYSYDLEEAVQKRDLKEVRRCVEEGADVNISCSPLDDSLIHNLLSDGCYSKECTTCILDCLKLLLESGANPNKVNALGRTPLDVAVDNMLPSEIVTALIDHGATFISNNGITNRQLAKKLAAKMPHAFNHMLDHAVKFSPVGKLANGRRLVELDWRYIVYNRDTTIAGNKWQETRFLNDVLSMGSSAHIILTHPLAAAFLKLKGRIYWWNFGIFYCLWIVSTFILYMIFVWNVYNDECSYRRGSSTSTSPGYQDSSSTTTTSSTEEEDGTLCHFRLTEKVMSYVIVSMFISGQILLEIRKLFALGPWTYAKQWQNYVFIPTSVFLIMTLWPALFSGISGDEYRLTWHYPCAAVGMLIASLSIMVQMTPITYVVLYAEMLYKVFIRIMVASLGFSPLFLGFFYGFRILLTNETIGAFELLTMVVSDAEYEEMMDKGRGIFYDLIAYTFFSAFIIILVIVVLNFLIGLAVSDIQELQVSARATRFCNMVRSYYIMDAVYGATKASVIKENLFTFEFDPLDSSDTRLPQPVKLHLLEMARNKCSCCCIDKKPATEISAYRPGSEEPQV